MLAALIGTAAMPPARAAATATVPGNVSTWAIAANKSGTAAESAVVDIAVHMALRHADSLKKFVDAVSKPGNALYGHYLTKEQFRAAYAPEAADAAAVKALLLAAGMKDVVVGPANAYVFARATIAQLRSTFGVTQHIYRIAGHTLRANAEAPSIPASLAGKVLFIEGLDDSDILRHPNHHSATREGPLKAPAGAAATATAVTPPPVADSDPSPYCSTYVGDNKATLSTAPFPYNATENWLVCGYTPQQIRQAYGLNKVKFTGAGITIAITDAYASPTIESDANAYAKNHGLPPLKPANFKQDIPNGIYGANPNAPCEPYGWWGEESLDVAAVHGSAPGARILYVGTTDCGTSLTIGLENVIYNYEADIVTNSWSDNGESVEPGSIAALDQVFETAAAQGQTVLFSSGDDGDLSQDNGVASGAYPSTSPYVTGVGGTSLYLYGPLGAKGEWGWGNNRDFLTGVTIKSASSVTTSGLETTSNFGYTYSDFTFYAGSGGGISIVEPQPGYQASVVPATLATTLNEADGYSVPLSTPMRVSPDVSMVADPYTGYLYGETYTIAGNGYSDIGCTAISTTAEYCEGAIGGTSLASPLMAGMIAVVDQARLAAGKPVVGFANPWFYSNKIGTTLQSGGINDVTAPPTPVALLRGYANPADASELRLVTINSVPFDIYVTTPFVVEPCGYTICEGIDDVFNIVTPGYDDVTGLGVPYAPNLVNQ